MGKAVYASAPCEDAEEARRTLIDTLIRGRTAPALIQIYSLYERYSTDKLSELLTYLVNNTEWICDYDRLRSEGYPVGSGSVEKAVDIVINRRVRCRRGMRWWRDNADSVVALRTLMLNDDWDILWSHNHHHP